MATDYSGRYSKPLGCSRHAMGGAAEGLGIEALAGDTEMVTVFDDFNGVVKGTDTFGGAAIFEDSGWVLTDIGAPTNDAISMNDVSDVAALYNSCLTVYGGDADDAGGSMALDLLNGAIGTEVGTQVFPHMWIPETAAGAGVNDNSTWVFATRVGIRADLTTTGNGDWDSKFFIGFQVAGETNIMTAATGALIVAGADDILYGFHCGEDGSVDGIAQRLGTTAYAAGTNFTELIAAGGVDGTVANGAVTAGDTMWFDLAFRMDIVDQSDAANNGRVRFFHRKVLPGRPLGDWNPHPAVLTNQCPNHTVALVPVIEMINGPTATVDGIIFLDWWAFGRNRVNR
ncbi:MAG: hypothetical protein A2139_02355 [Desulfobacca sp. RBG_16_60_12]|nr:MAG: hypothetical protein A2139_02355 [Desulfobacca sp. RBG_16_60_12]